MSGIMIATENFSNVESGGMRCMLKAASLRVLASLVERSSSGRGELCVCTSPSLTGYFSPGFRKKNKIVEYNTHLIRWQNENDFTSLHGFCDRLYELSLAQGEGSGLVCHGLPLLKLLETRWMGPLFTTILAYAGIASEYLDEYKPASLVLAGSSEREKMFGRMAAFRGVPVTKLGGLAECITGLYTPKYAREFSGMRQRQLRELCVNDAPVVGAYGRQPRPRIIFIGRINRTVERLVACAPALKQEGSFGLGLLADSRVTLAQQLRDEGFACSYTREWLGKKEAAALCKSTTVAACESWRKLERDSSLSQWLCHGIPIIDFAAPILRTVCREGCSVAAMAAEIADRFVNVAEPVCTVHFEDSELNRAVTMLCGNKGIPTVAYYSLSGNSYPGLVRRTQQWMAVSSDVVRAEFGPQYAFDRIRLVGDTLNDLTFGRDDDDLGKRVRVQLGLPEEEKVVVLLSTYPAPPYTLGDIRMLFQRTFKAAQDTGARVVVKAHPLQPVAEVRKWMSLWDCRGTLIRDFDLLSLLRCADLVSAPITSAVWQAMLAGVPVVSIQPRELLQQYEDIGYDYLKGKGVYFISPDSDAAKVFKALLFDAGAREEQVRKGLAHAREHCGPLDGKSGERLVHFLKDIIEQKV